MMRSGILLATLAVSGCSYFQSGGTTEPAPATAQKTTPARARPAVLVTSSAELLSAMHDPSHANYVKTSSFLQNNTRYTTTGQKVKSQWYEHIEVPGKLRIAFLPASQKSGLVQVGDRVATFDNGIRVDFRPSVNPLLLLTADVYVSPIATVMRGLDSLHVDPEMIRTDEWEGQSVYVVGAKAGDSTSSQMWVDRDQLRLVRFIQSSQSGARTIVSDIRV